MSDIIRITDESGQRWYAHESDRENSTHWAASVTGILSIVVPPKRLAWHTNTDPAEQKQRKTFAGDFGSEMHRLIEADLRGEQIHIEDETLSECFDKWLALRSEHWINAEQIETMVISDRYGFGGTFDLIGVCDHERAIMDLKTGFVGVSAGWQLEAYRHAWFEMYGEWLPTITIAVPRNGKPAQVFKNVHNDWQWAAFVSAFQCWKSVSFYDLKAREWTWLHRGFFEETTALAEGWDSERSDLYARLSMMQATIDNLTAERDALREIA